MILPSILTKSILTVINYPISDWSLLCELHCYDLIKIALC